MEKNIEISLLFDFYKPLLTESQQQAVELYYNDDYSLAEIAQEMNITRQGVRDLVKRSENLLFAYEEKLGLFKRFNLMENGLDEICSLAQNIIDKTDDSSAKSNAQKILTFAEGLKE
ncbi:MAG: YlxM family DNA-binding protein [bacterium]|nr:YlxM family DNA-binding protein [bacterium]